MGKLYIGNSESTPAIVNVKEVEKTLFGLGLDEWVGVLDENGVLKHTTKPCEFNAVGLKDVSNYIFYCGLYDNPTVVSANFPNLTTVSGSSGCYAMFYGCSDLTRVGLENLTIVSGYGGCHMMFYYCFGLTRTGLENLTTVSGTTGCSSMFGNCRALISTGLENLTTISGQLGCDRMFGDCWALTSTGLENLTTVSGSSGCSNMFNSCKGLTKEYFPMLTTVTQANAFGTSSSNGIFYGCPNLTELHFRKDAQAVIEGLTVYQYKFGATNATIYFDLIGTITVGGVEYARDEKQSIRVDGVKTFVGWKDANDNVVYTSYADNAEPAVDTVVYSDQGTTQVGTVEAVA